MAGRHVRTLEPVTILLGDAPAVSGAQRFYQLSQEENSQATVDRSSNEDLNQS